MWGAGGKTQGRAQSPQHSHHRRPANGRSQAPGKMDRQKCRRFFPPPRPLASTTAQSKPATKKKSISNEITFGEDERDPELVEQRLMDLADKVGGRLRKAGFYAATAQIKVRWADFSTITPSATPRSRLLRRPNPERNRDRASKERRPPLSRPPDRLRRERPARNGRVPRNSIFSNPWKNRPPPNASNSAAPSTPFANDSDEPASTEPPTLKKALTTEYTEDTEIE